MYQQVGNIYKLKKDVDAMSKKIVNIQTHKELKKTKIYIEHIEAVLKIVNLSIKGLDGFKAYKAVVEMLLTLKEQKSILEAHLTKLKQTMRNNEN